MNKKLSWYKLEQDLRNLQSGYAYTWNKHTISNTSGILTRYQLINKDTVRNFIDIEDLLYFVKNLYIESKFYSSFNK